MLQSGIMPIARTRLPRSAKSLKICQTCLRMCTDALRYENPCHSNQCLVVRVQRPHCLVGAYIDPNETLHNLSTPGSVWSRNIFKYLTVFNVVHVCIFLDLLLCNEYHKNSLFFHSTIWFNMLVNFFVHDSWLLAIRGATFFTNVDYQIHLRKT